MAIGQGPFNAYTDIQSLRLARAPALDYQSYLGASTVLSAPTTVGGTTLTVTSSAGVDAGQMVFILDGAQSEIVFSDPTAPTPSETSITIQAPGCQFIHAPMTDVSTAGPSGALALTIRQASAYLENYCQQGTIGDRGLLTKTRTERLRMPTTRAMIDPSYALSVRPRSLPIQSVSALSIEYAPGAAFTLDPSQIEMDSTARSFRVPVMTPLGGGPISAQLIDFAPVGRGDQAWCVLTYVAGVSWTTMPWDLQMACEFIAQEFLAYAENPTGAAMLREGGVQVMQRLRGSGGKESSIDSLIMSQAKTLLEAYRNQFY